MWRRNPVVDVLVFGIHAPCEAVWNVVACPEAAPLLGDCDAAAFRDGDVPGAGARVVQRYHTDGVSTREVEFTVEHWEPPHALVVSLPGEVTAYRFSPGPHGTSMTIEHRFVCPKGWRGGVQRRAAHQSQRRHGRAVRRLAESGWRPSPGSPGSLGG